VAAVVASCSRHRRLDRLGHRQWHAQPGIQVCRRSVTRHGLERFCVTTISAIAWGRHSSGLQGGVYHRDQNRKHQAEPDLRVNQL